MKQQIKMLEHYFLIHNRHIDHQDLQVNIMHKDMTPNALIENEMTYCHSAYNAENELHVFRKCPARSA